MHHQRLLSHHNHQQGLFTQQLSHDHHLLVILAPAQADCFHSHMLCHHYHDLTHVGLVAIPSFQEHHRHRSLGVVEEVVV